MESVAIIGREKEKHHLFVSEKELPCGDLTFFFKGLNILTK